MAHPFPGWIATQAWLNRLWLAASVLGLMGGLAPQIFLDVARHRAAPGPYRAHSRAFMVEYPWEYQSMKKEPGWSKFSKVISAITCLVSANVTAVTYWELMLISIVSAMFFVCSYAWYWRLSGNAYKWSWGAVALLMLLLVEDWIARAKHF